MPPPRSLAQEYHPLLGVMMTSGSSPGALPGKVAVTLKLSERVRLTGANT